MTSACVETRTVTGPPSATMAAASISSKNSAGIPERRPPGRLPFHRRLRSSQRTHQPARVASVLARFAVSTPRSNTAGNCHRYRSTTAPFSGRPWPQPRWCRSRRRGDAARCDRREKRAVDRIAHRVQQCAIQTRLTARRDVFYQFACHHHQGGRLNRRQQNVDDRHRRERFGAALGNQLALRHRDDAGAGVERRSLESVISQQPVKY